MTYFQAILARLSYRFSPENIATVDPEILASDLPLVDALEKLDIPLSDHDRRYVGSWPHGLQQAIRGAVHSAVNRKEKLAVTFGGAPSAFFEVTIWEASGGMAILFRGPIPL